MTSSYSRVYLMPAGLPITPWEVQMNRNWSREQQQLWKIVTQPFRMQNNQKALEKNRWSFMPPSPVSTERIHTLLHRDGGMVFDFPRSSVLSF